MLCKLINWNVLVRPSARDKFSELRWLAVIQGCSRDGAIHAKRGDWRIKLEPGALIESCPTNLRHWKPKAFYMLKDIPERRYRKYSYGVMKNACNFWVTRFHDLGGERPREPNYLETDGSSAPRPPVDLICSMIRAIYHNPVRVSILVKFNECAAESASNFWLNLFHDLKCEYPYEPYSLKPHARHRDG